VCKEWKLVWALTTAALIAVWEPDELRFKNHHRALLQTKLPTYVVELSSCGKFILPKADLQVQGWGRFWRKENLLNLLEPLVPDQFDHLIWLDSGVALLESELEPRLEKALQTHTFAQPFSSCDWIGPGGGVEIEWGAYAKGGPDASVGMAWAMKRSTWRSLGGLWAGDILDSTELERAMVGEETSSGAKKWLSQIPTPSFGFAEGQAIHYWHKITKRLSPEKRQELLAQLNYDPTRHLTINSQGVLEITNPEILRFASSYVGQTYA
jgi:hypothetical protein